MFKNSKKYSLIILVFLLIYVNVYIFKLDWGFSHRNLTLAMLDIGEGDALFIESPTGTQLLVDSGPPGKILNKLSEVMPFFDKRIDGIIVTNPNQNNTGGFIDVLKNYKVGEVFESGILGSSLVYKNLENNIKAKNIPDVFAKRGMQLDIGGGVVVDILFPDRDISDWNTKDGSIVAKLIYGNTSFMLTGNATSETEKIILAENSNNSLKSDVLKVSHGGSKDTTSSSFVQAVSPKYALISNQKDNTYGYPNQETLNILSQYGVQVFRTDILGNIIMKSDGQNISFSFHK